MKTELERRLEAEGTIRIGSDYQASGLPSVGDKGDIDESQCFWNPDRVDPEDFLEKATELNWPQYPALSLLASVGTGSMYASQSFIALSVKPDLPSNDNGLKALFAITEFELFIRLQC